MPFTSKIEITFDRKTAAPDADIQFYRVYRKKNAIPDRTREELVFIISQPFFPENLTDTITRTDSQLPQIGISYDPLEQIRLTDPRGAPYKIAIDDSMPIPPTNLLVIPDPADNGSDIGGIFLQWTASVSVGSVWGYDITAVDAGGLESPEGAALHPSETTKLETLDIGLADGITPAPSEYPLAGQVFSTYLIEGGSSNFNLSNQTSIMDTNTGSGWDTDGPSGVQSVSASSNFPLQSIMLRWTELLKNIGTDLSNRKFKVTAYTKAGYTNASTEIPGPTSVICPITNGQAGLKITRLDATKWHDGITDKNQPSPPPEIILAPQTLDNPTSLQHGSIIRGSVYLTDTGGLNIYVEDSGTFNFPNGDGDYIIDYSRVNGENDIGGRVKILSSGIIQPGQTLRISYKFGVNYGTGPNSMRPTVNDPILGTYNGLIWSGTGPQSFIDSTAEMMSAYNYAWFVTDNAGRTTAGIRVKYAQGILQDVIFPGPVQNFKVEAVQA